MDWRYRGEDRGGGGGDGGWPLLSHKKKLLKEVLAGFHYLPELTALFPAAEPSMAAVGWGWRGGGGWWARGEHCSAEAH